jgi:hypothetical protein
MMRKRVNGFLDGDIKAPTKNLKMNGLWNFLLDQKGRKTKKIHERYYGRIGKRELGLMRVVRGRMGGRNRGRRKLPMW